MRVPDSELSGNVKRRRRRRLDRTRAGRANVKAAWRAIYSPDGTDVKGARAAGFAVRLGAAARPLRCALSAFDEPAAAFRPLRVRSIIGWGWRRPWRQKEEP